MQKKIRGGNGIEVPNISISNNDVSQNLDSSLNPTPKNDPSTAKESYKNAMKIYRSKRGKGPK